MPSFPIRRSLAVFTVLLMSCAPAPEGSPDYPPMAEPIVIGEIAAPAPPPAPALPPESGSVDLVVVAQEPVIVVEEQTIVMAASEPVFAEAVVVSEPVFETINQATELRNYRRVRLFFGTNRQLVPGVSSTDPTAMFTNTNAPDLTYGTATVSIPLTHERGTLETQGRISAALFGANPERFVILEEMQPMSQRATMALIDSVLDTQDSILMYVHGFNTPLEMAARRAGQMTYDLDWHGPSFFFTWPSQGSPAAYTVDQTMAERSERALVQVLTDLTVREKAKRIVIIAHSMGTQVLTQSLLRLHAANPDAARRISTIVLAAPDIDEDIFKNDIVPVFADMPQTDVTLYASEDDTALLASKVVNGFPRIGDAKFGIAPLEPVKVVNATGAESDFFGHTYFGDNETIISDIVKLVHDRIRPPERDTLIGVPDVCGPTWRIKLPGDATPRPAGQDCANVAGSGNP